LGELRTAGPQQCLFLEYSRRHPGLFTLSPIGTWFFYSAIFW